MTVFDPVHPETWEPLLTIDQVSAIYHRTPAAIRQQVHQQRRSAVTAKSWLPLPAFHRPLQWRRDDIKRHVFGAHSPAIARRA